MYPKVQNTIEFLYFAPKRSKPISDFLRVCFTNSTIRCTTVSSTFQRIWTFRRFRFKKMVRTKHRPEAIIAERILIAEKTCRQGKKPNITKPPIRSSLRSESSKQSQIATFHAYTYKIRTLREAKASALFFSSHSYGLNSFLSIVRVRSHLSSDCVFRGSVSQNNYRTVSVGRKKIAKIPARHVNSELIYYGFSECSE